MTSILKLTRLPRLFFDLGLSGAVRYLITRLGALARGQPAANAKIDLFRQYEFLRPAEPSQASPPHYRPSTMNWVIPGYEAGSGGHMTIFRMIFQLEQLGYQSCIVIVGDHRFKRGDEARQFIHRHFLPVQARVSLGEGSLQPAEFTVATEWRTAYSVRRFDATAHKLYFIQDMEPYFFPSGSHYAFAEATYRFGFTGITVGDWLADEVRARYGMRAYPFNMSYPKEQPQFKHSTAESSGRRRVFFYARHVTPRRGFELGLLALKCVYDQVPDVEFVLAGWDVSGYHIPFPHVNAGTVAPDELAGLYRQCDVALVLSLTNLSLLPIELMACACPVVSNRGPNVEWQLSDGDNALLADAAPEALAQALLKVLGNDDLRQRLIANGLRFAQASDWATEGRKVADYLQRISDGSTG